MTVWTGVTGGAVTFTFVGSAGAADITFGFMSDTGFCGVSTPVWDPDSGQMISADVKVSQPIYRGPQCVRTVTHETAHAIGFLGHTSDGGLMDVDGGNGEITPLVAGVLRDLYLLPPGTLVTAEAKQLGLGRSGGRKTMTFMYPVRQ